MQPLYVVVAGTLAKGVKGRAVLEQNAASILAGQLQVEGLLAEALPLGDPSKEGYPAADPVGKYVVLFGDVVQGLTAVGPFSTEDMADEYGENCPMGDFDDVVYSVLTVEEEE
jgi:hypothetical protein